MKIDPKTLLFSEWSLEEGRDMYAWACGVTLGPDPRKSDHPDWLKQWFQVAGYDERQALLVMTTMLPARIFLSLLKEKERREELKAERFRQRNPPGLAPGHTFNDEVP